MKAPRKVIAAIAIAAVGFGALAAPAAARPKCGFAALEDWKRTKRKGPNGIVIEACFKITTTPDGDCNFRQRKIERVPVSECDAHGA